MDQGAKSTGKAKQNRKRVKGTRTKMHIYYSRTNTSDHTSMRPHVYQLTACASNN